MNLESCDDNLMCVRIFGLWQAAHKISDGLSLATINVGIARD
jgi:hypothetical protein